MSSELIRIFSDIHYGDRASQAKRLGQLRPLLEGVTRLVLNGDTLDTRRGPRNEFTAEKHAEVTAFVRDCAPSVTLLTGNHDPDVSAHHALDLAAGRVFVTHGDILFDNIVPWGRDAALIGRLITAELARHSPAEREPLEARFAIWRRVAASVPQQHQSEPHRLKYALRFAADTIWPPLRIFRILRAWQIEPGLAAALAHRHRPAANFIVVGHTHRPRVWRAPNGVIVINTGSFCAPFGGYAVDLTAGRLAVRRVQPRAGEFHPGELVAEFALAEG